MIKLTPPFPASDSDFARTRPALFVFRWGYLYAASFAFMNLVADVVWPSMGSNGHPGKTLFLSVFSGLLIGVVYLRAARRSKPAVP